MWVPSFVAVLPKFAEAFSLKITNFNSLCDQSHLSLVSTEQYGSVQFSSIRHSWEPQAYYRRAFPPVTWWVGGPDCASSVSCVTSQKSDTTNKGNSAGLPGSPVASCQKMAVNHKLFNC